MRARSRVGSCFHAVASLALLWAGCGGDDFASPEGGFGGAGAGGSGGESGSGGTGGTAPGCVPSVNVDPVEESCGVFVSSSLGAAGGDGSKDKPFKSIQSALAAAKGKPIYVCAEDAAYDEKLVVTGAVRLYGGLDCKDDWKYHAAKPTRVAPAKGVPLTVSDVSGTVGIEDFEFEAADAAEDGASSVGAFVKGSSDVKMEHVRIAAGKGMKGADGTVVSFTFPTAADLNGKNALGRRAEPRGRAYAQLLTRVLVASAERLPQAGSLAAPGYRTTAVVRAAPDWIVVTAAPARTAALPATV